MIRSKPPYIIFLLYMIVMLQPAWIGFIVIRQWSASSQSYKPNIHSSELIEEVDSILPPDARVLIMRHSDYGYYGKYAYIDHNDPDLIPFYQSTDPQLAWRWLVDHGITHILLPYYNPPHVYRTVLDRILSDPSLAGRIRTERSTRLYRILNEPCGHDTTTQLIHFDDITWTQQTIIDLSYIDRYADAITGPVHVKDNQTNQATCIINEYRKHTRLYTDSGPVNTPPNMTDTQSMPNQIAMIPGQHYMIRSNVHGSGLVKFYLHEYIISAANVSYPKIHLIDEHLLHDESIQLAGQYQSSESMNAYRLVYVLQGRGYICVEDIAISKIQYKSSGVQ